MDPLLSKQLPLGRLGLSIRSGIGEPLGNQTPSSGLGRPVCIITPVAQEPSGLAAGGRAGPTPETAPDQTHFSLKAGSTLYRGCNLPPEGAPCRRTSSSLSTRICSPFGSALLLPNALRRHRQHKHGLVSWYRVRILSAALYVPYGRDHALLDPWRKEPGPKP